MWHRRQTILTTSYVFSQSLNVAKHTKHAATFTLGIGDRDDEGLPYILECVREAEARLLAKELNHEYAPIIGVFAQAATIT